MTLSVTSVGGNPQQPSIQAEAFIPDQLIAGSLKIVTDNATITGSALLARGSVLGQITIGAATSAAKSGGNTGNGTLVLDVTTPILANAEAGIYTVRCIQAVTNGGVFEVKNPTGRSLGEAIIVAGVSGTYTFSDQIKFVITDGASDFIVGDGFDVTIAAGSGKYKLAAVAAVDGSATPVAILIDTADAVSGDVNAGIYIHGEFNGAALTLGTGTTLAAATTALRKVGIYIKTSVSASDPT